MQKQLQDVINQIRRMAQITGIEPDPKFYVLQGSVWQRMATRLELLAKFLGRVNDQLQETAVNSKPQQEAKPKAKKPANKPGTKKA